MTTVFNIVMIWILSRMTIYPLSYLPSYHALFSKMWMLSSTTKRLNVSRFTTMNTQRISLHNRLIRGVCQEKISASPAVVTRSHSTAVRTLSIQPRPWTTAIIATRLVEIAEHANSRPFFHGECLLNPFTCNPSNFRMWWIDSPADWN